MRQTTWITEEDLMDIDTHTRVGDVAARHPLATRVFARHGIDFCCGGGQPLASACEERALDPEKVLAEIEKEVTATETPETDWTNVPLGQLIDHIVNEYHVPLREELPRLTDMSAKVLRAHGDKEPEKLRELATVVAGLRAELEAHMMKEERILFPLIRQGRGAMAAAPVSVMEHEHDGAAEALRRLRDLTDGYEAPPEACNTWRALWHGLADLERAMHEHIHLENNVLFPNALSGAAV
jgi:regulator of cell morphogenesis and NO signaling